MLCVFESRGYIEISKIRIFFRLCVKSNSRHIDELHFAKVHKTELFHCTVGLQSVVPTVILVDVISHSFEKKNG